MALPRAIQAQIDQANAMLNAANAPAETAPPNEPAPAPAPVENLAPVPPSEPSATPAVETPAPAAPQPDVWEQRYKTLQGLFNSEVPKLQSETRTLKQQLEEAIGKLNEVAQRKPEPVPDKPKVDPRDVENFGSDLVEMVQRVTGTVLADAANEFKTVATRLEARVQQLEQVLQGTTQTVAATAEQTFFDRLTKLVPSWEQINQNPAFLAWLGEVDPLLGSPRQEVLNAGHKQLNAERVAAVFNAFEATLPKAPKPNAVDRQVSPRGSASVPTAAPAAPMIFTQQQVVDFYTAKRRGEFRGRDAEAAALEAQFNLAIAEGRVR